MIFLTILSALLFYVFPTLVGRTIMRIFSKNSLSYPFVSYFITGSLALYGLVLATYYSFLFLLPSVSFGTIFPILLAVIAFLMLPINIFFGRSDLSFKKYIIPAIISAILSAVVYFLWHLHSPYPFNWDLFEHQTLINNILSGRFSLISSHISDTFGFNSYSTIFQTLIAGSQVYFKEIPILQYWDVVGYFHFFLVVLASYLLGKEITGNKTIAFLSALLGAFIFDSNISFTSLFFMPQTFTAVTFIFLLIQLFNELKKGIILHPFIVFLGCTFLILNHYVIGTVGCLIYLGTYLYFKYPQILKDRNYKTKLMGLSIFIGFLSMIFSSFINLGFLNHGEASAFTPTFTDKFTAMRQAYGYILLMFLPIGVFVTVKKRKDLELFFLFITLGLIFIVLLQLPYVMKFYALLKFFIQLFMAIGIYSVMKRIKLLPLSLLAYFLLVLSLGLIFITNAFIWKDILTYKNISTQVSAQEIQAATFIRAHYANTNTLIISDPATQNIIEALSTVNSQGGAYMNSNSRNILAALKTIDDPAKAATELYGINDKFTPTTGKRLLLLSGRYFIWQQAKTEDKNAFSYNVWAPVDLTLSDIQKINTLLKNNHFSLVYFNPTIAVLEVSR